MTDKWHDMFDFKRKFSFKFKHHGHSMSAPKVCLSIDVLLQSVAVCCSVLQRVVSASSIGYSLSASDVILFSCVLQCAQVCRSVMQCAAVCCSVLQCAAVCCSVLQCAAVWCSVLRCDAV